MVVNFFKGIFKVYVPALLIWFFGFYSLFSGQAIYDVILYNFYNVFFTQAPIMWYAVFDWEAKKEKFLERPRLYKIGLEDIYFNSKTFWANFAYACV